MKLPVDALRSALALLTALTLSACATTGAAPLGDVAAERSIANGPESDYPVVVGAPYSVGAITYTPVDTLNYDEVGYAARDESAGPGVTAGHHTLPLPSYVEVTALDTGKTILVRVERRGPMASNELVALSDDALAQLGARAGTPVRVRRVNPPEDDRAELRADKPAPARMNTPPGLLEVLKRRLPASGSVSLADPRQAEVSGKVPTPGLIATLDPDTAARPISVSVPVAIKTARAVPAVAREAAAAASQTIAEAPGPAPSGTFMIQLGTFSVKANAHQLARRVGGTAVESGKFTLVRVGPFSSRGQAEQALAKLRGQGYSDARIQTRK